MLALLYACLFFVVISSKSAEFSQHLASFDYDSFPLRLQLQNIDLVYTHTHHITHNKPNYTTHHPPTHNVKTVLCANHLQEDMYT